MSLRVESWVGVGPGLLDQRQDRLSMPLLLTLDCPLEMNKLDCGMNQIGKLFRTEIIPQV